ncbi:MAG: endonuclease/exonuclease/phosphatase family protein [Clostridia bacterium]|nr:endonuclease/exonuclease/phosphatase family protein [Clostridia bacterium]
MKLITLNTHSLVEKNYNKKLKAFISLIKKYDPDIISLQEVMQPKDAKKAQKTEKILSLGKIPVREENHVLTVLNRLIKEGFNYNCAWLGIKQAYDKYEEGVCILSKWEIDEIKSILLSPFDVYENWKTRKTIGIRVKDRWFYSIHLSWWDDTESPSKYEIETLYDKTNKEKTWLLGDFNCPSNEKNKGYDLLLNYWKDTFVIAEKKDDGITVKGKIDGWKNSESKRIDYILTNENIKIKSSQVIFNGKNGEIVSDHFGILVETEENI